MPAHSRLQAGFRLAENALALSRSAKFIIGNRAVSWKAPACFLNFETSFMQATRILPDLQTSLICEEVRQEMNGNFILVGVIGIIRVPQVPVTAFKLCVFNRWTAGVGAFTESVRLVAPDQSKVLRQSQVKFGLNDANQNATNVTVFGQIEFTTGGVYYVEVLVDEVMKLRYPLPLVVVPPPSQAAQPQTETQ